MEFKDLAERVGASERVFVLKLDGTKADLGSEVQFASFFGEFSRAQGAFDNPVYRKQFGAVYAQIDRLLACLGRPVCVQIGLGPRGYAISCLPVKSDSSSFVPGFQSDMGAIEKFFGTSFDVDYRTGGFMGAKMVSLELPSVVPEPETVEVR